MKNKNFIIVVFVLTTACMVALLSYLPNRFDNTSEIKVADFPKTIGQWSSRDIPLTEKDYSILETKNLFVRDYKDARGQSVYLYLVYSEDNRKVSHPPEVCYMGSGVTIVNKSSVKIAGSIPATEFIVEKGNIRQLVVYWFKAGNIYTDQYLKQQSKIAMGRLFGRRTSGALIRLSADIKDGGVEEAFKLIDGFAVEIKPLLEQYIP